MSLFCACKKVWHDSDMNKKQNSNPPKYHDKARSNAILYFSLAIGTVVYIILMTKYEWDVKDGSGLTSFVNSLFTLPVMFFFLVLGAAELAKAKPINTKRAFQPLGPVALCAIGLLFLVVPAMAIYLPGKFGEFLFYASIFAFPIGLVLLISSLSKFIEKLLKK